MKGASLIAPLGVRIPDDLKEKIQSQAKENGRSTNAEIVQILENSLTSSSDREVEELKSIVAHKDELLKKMQEIIELQKESMSHMESTISSLKSHVSILEDHVTFLKKNCDSNKKPT